MLLTAYAWTSDTMYGKIDGTFLGIISITVRSSTNLARGSQWRIRSLTITANSSGPKRVPWGMPPFNLQGGEEDEAILTIDLIHKWRLINYSFFYANHPH